MTSGQRKSYSVVSNDIFLIRGLTVSSEVIEDSHDFEFEGCGIEIILPKLSEVKEGYEDGVKASVAGIYPIESQTINYDIHQVIVRVNKSQSLSIDPQSFDRKPVAYDLYTEFERNEFDRICDEYRGIAISAFEHWITVLRWVVDDFRIGRDERLGFDSRRSTSLEESEKHRIVWRRGLSYTIHQERVVNLKEWGKVAGLLGKGKSPPIYFSLKQDAEENLKHGNYKISIIELAMACEIFLRTYVLNLLPKDLDHDLVKAIEELNVNQYVMKHFKNIVLEEYMFDYKKKIQKELSSLFSKRNELVHMGNHQGATKDNCQRFVLLAELLFSFREKIKKELLQDSEIPHA
ncbi:hypothetical protein [uncultured Gimesia sp.]|uniref:hypothetical protein n=1 Tax=uncultured Gimesia sp. TaxID=1678688 RepID=UPI002631BADD|nr:hypothetical protein [uncultured Gimesia sp.]